MCLQVHPRRDASWGQNQEFSLGRFHLSAVMPPKQQFPLYNFVWERCAYPYMRASVQVAVCVHMWNSEVRVHVCVCMQNPEVNVGCFAKLLSTVFPETESQPLRLAGSVGLAGHQPREALLFSVPQFRRQVPALHLAFLHECGDQAHVLILTVPD